MFDSKEYLIGFITGFLIIVAAAVILFALLKRKNMVKTEYDERQQLARGKAFTAAFLVLAVYLILDGMFNMVTDIVWADRFTENFIGISISAMVFAIYSIQKDAYISFKQNPRLIIISFSLLAVVNIILGIMTAVIGDGFVTGGALNFHTANLVIAVMFIILTTVYIIKLSADKKNKE